MRCAKNSCEERSRAQRHGFTVVELLVAAAVSMVLMVILTEAFKNGIDMFRTLRSQGQMMDRLRITTTTMRNDLASYHFDAAAATGYLGQLRLDLGWSPPGSALGTPAGADGFFRIYQAPDVLFNPPGAANPNSLPAVFEGTDGDGILMSRATTHYLHFAVCNRETSPIVAANNPVDPSYLFRVVEPSRPVGTANWPINYIDPVIFQENGIFASRWAEVAYFLAPQTTGNGSFTSIVPGTNSQGLPLFNLYRRVKVVLPDTVPNGAPPPVYPVPASGVGFVENPKISARTDFTGGVPSRKYNIASDVTEPCNRMCMGPTDSNANTYAAGLICPFPGTPPTSGTPTGTPPGQAYHRLSDDLTLGLNDPRSGDDLLLSDVISFEVKATWDVPPGTPPGSPLWPSKTYNIPAISAGTPNSDYPFDYIPFSPDNPMFMAQSAGGQGLGIRVFDSWSSIGIYGTLVGTAPNQVPAWDGTAAKGTASPASLPLRIRIKALLIRIRIWDAKAQQTREITIIQDM